MNTKHKILAAFILAIFSFRTLSTQDDDARFVSYAVDAKVSAIEFYWKDSKDQVFRSIQNLKLFLESENKELKFAMNGGMYTKDNSPQASSFKNR